jgi:hypothetical protein
MGAKVLVAIAVSFLSLSCAAQVAPAGRAGRVALPINWSLGGGLDYWSGDWGHGNIERLGPSAWATATIWHCLGINVEGHSMIGGGSGPTVSKYKLFVGEGGLMCTMGYWGRFQPIFKGEVGFASLSQPAPGRPHATYGTWAVGGGGEYHLWGHWWARVDCAPKMRQPCCRHFSANGEGRWETRSDIRRNFRSGLSGG